MKDTELKTARDRALYEAYLKAIREHTFVDYHACVDYVRKSRAPQFFLSPKSLSNYLGLIFSGKDLISELNDASLRRVWELYDRYMDYIEEHDCTGVSRERICEILVEQEAPEFYLGRERAIQILNRERKRARRQIQARYKQ